MQRPFRQFPVLLLVEELVQEGGIDAEEIVEPHGGMA
jgi:hypothetical protein